MMKYTYQHFWKRKIFAKVEPCCLSVSEGLGHRFVGGVTRQKLLSLIRSREVFA